MSGLQFNYDAEKSYEYEGEVWTYPTTRGRLDECKTMTFQEGDVIVASYGKSGTTWAKYLVYQILHEDPLTRPIMEAVPYLEMSPLTVDQIMDRPSPRIFSTHLPTRFLEKEVNRGKVKVVYVRRNPKDALVSSFHFHQMNSFLGSFAGTWDQFFELYRQKRLHGGDIIQYNAAWWELSKKQVNVLPITYEEMKRDLRGVIRRLSVFLGQPSDNFSDERLEGIINNSQFSAMKDNKLTNLEDLNQIGIMDFSKSSFIRKGEVGQWKEYFSPEQLAYVDEEERKATESSSLHFDYE